MIYSLLYDSCVVSAYDSFVALQLIDIRFLCIDCVCICDSGGKECSNHASRRNTRGYTF